MEHKLQLTYDVIILQHDGYCSGDECEFKKSVIIEYVDVPYEFKKKYFKYEEIPLDVIDESYLYKKMELEVGSNYCDRTYVPDKYKNYECNTTHYELKSVMIVEKE